MRKIGSLRFLAGLVWTLAAGILLLPPTTIRAKQAPTYSVVYAFQGGTDGMNPQASLAVDALDNLYGATPYGGTYSYGTIFKIDTSGNKTILYNFTGGVDGNGPGGVILDPAGNLYGITGAGGVANLGVVFKLDKKGNETVLHSFGTSEDDGETPEADLLRDPAGNLYGTTAGGGTIGYGTVFMIDQSGNLTTLHSFTGLPADGEAPFAALVRDSAGNLYGTTQQGGSGGGGTVFEIDASGNETVLYSFTGSNGLFPDAPVLRDTTGNLYGTTVSGGPRSTGVAFKLDPLGNETILHNFLDKADGGDPQAGFVQDSAGNLYATTVGGGSFAGVCESFGGCGVIFRLSPAGNETLLYTFTAGTGGSTPRGNLLPYKGNLYGTAGFGGNTSGSCSPNGCGVVFKLRLQ